MNASDYANLCAFLHQKSGIVLGENKGYLIESRLSPIARDFGYLTADEMVSQLAQLPKAAGEAIVDAMTTNESFFFRDTTPFKLFEEKMLPAITEARRTDGRIRIWCAAAATGQEPYSLAMILLAKRRLWAGLKVEIVATDISRSALARARAGRYSQFEVQRGLPVTMLIEHFSQEGTTWVISEEVRKMVRFSEFNLLEPVGALGVFDIVFCRNVLIYFDVTTKKSVLEGIHGNMRADGFLVLGAAETLMGVTDIFERAEGERGLYQPQSRTSPDRLTA